MRSSDLTVEVETFTTWYDEHARTLLRFCARRVGSEAAEDVVAATFLTAYERRGDYDPARADVLPWLYGIAVEPPAPAIAGTRSPGRTGRTARVGVKRP